MATTTRSTARKAAAKTARKATGTTAKKAAAKTARKAVATKAARPSAAPSSGTSSGGPSPRTAGAARTMALPSLADLRKLIGGIKVPGVDMAAIVDAQRKDLEALAEANRQAYEGIRALAERRSAMLREALVGWRDAMKGATGEDAAASGAERAKQGVQQAIDRFRELAEMEAETRRKAWKVLQDRFQENLAGVQNLLKPK